MQLFVRHTATRCNVTAARVTGEQTMEKMMNEDAHDASLADACPTGLGTLRNGTVAEVNVSGEAYRRAIA